MKRTTIIETIIFSYVVLFIYTGISKLLDSSTFKENIAESKVLEPVASLIAWGVPLVEFIIATLLIVPRWRLKGLYAALTIMSVFTTYVICLLIFAPNLPCSCGGIIQRLSWPQHIIFNCAFILLATWCIVLQKKENKAQIIASPTIKHKSIPI